MARKLAAAVLAVLGTSAAADAGALLRKGALALSAEGQAKQLQLEQEWSAQLDAKKQSPVQRVVALLHKMSAQLQAEASSEKEMYDKMVCWCETNDREKTQAIAAADAKDVELQSEIESRSARFGELSAEVAQLKEQIAKDKESLKEATAIREKAAAAFRQEEKELVQTINNLENAIAVLKKHNTGNFVQLDAPLMAGVNVLLQDVSLKYEVLVAGSAETRRSERKPRQQAALLAVKAGEKTSLSAGRDLLSILKASGQDVPQQLPLKFAQELVERAARRPQGSSSFLEASVQQMGKPASYSSRSTEIFGILNQMLDEFKSTLSTSQAAEAKAVQDYTALVQAKESEIEAGKAKLDELEGEHASNQKALADAKKDLTNTRKQRAADVEFLRNLKLTCNDLNTQWAQRSKTRGAEIQAVAETISILTEDDSHDLLTRSVSFVQLGAVRTVRAVSVEEADASMATRRAAIAALKLAAKAPEFDDDDDLLAAWHGRTARSALATVTRALGAAAGPRAQLSTLALTVQLDSFTKVREAIDNMVAELKAQQSQEVDFKAYCQQGFADNAKAVYAKQQEKGDLESKAEQLDAALQRLSREIDAANAQIAQAQVEIKKAGETREKENAEFQSTVADQRATQELLKKALARLEDFYKKGLGKALLAQKAVQTPPAQFNDYKENRGASPVMGLLEQIIEDSAKLEHEAVDAETSAQAAYESFVKDSNAVIAQLTEAVNVKTQAKATADVEKAQAESDHEDAVSELESLSQYKDDLHSECDFVLKNFDIRQQARLQEIEAIQAAKSILSGMK